MTIDVYDLNRFNERKAREAGEYISHLDKIDSACRAKARSFLKGLGVPSDYVDTLGTSEFTAIMQSPAVLARELEPSALEVIARRGYEVFEYWNNHSRAGIWLSVSKHAGNRTSTVTPEPEPVAEPEPVSEPTPRGPIVSTRSKREERAQRLLELLGDDEPEIDEEAIKALVSAEVDERMKAHAVPRQVQVVINNQALTATKPEHRHFLFDRVLECVAHRVPVLLVGPAGSGKTTVARQIAEALNLTFYAVSGVDSAYELKGFMDAHGRAVETDFQRAFTGGGVFLFDELDNSDPNAIKAMNSAIDNRFCDFASGIENAHEDFAIIAGANTYGRGQDRQYVGSNQLDASTINRFAVLDWDYDEALEAALAPNAQWCRMVQKWRRAKDALKIRHVISPRATIKGGHMIENAKWTFDFTADAYVWQGLDRDQVEKIKAEAA